MLFRRCRPRRSLARRLRLDEMECRWNPATAIAIDPVSLTGPEGTAINLTATVTDPVAPTFEWTVTKNGTDYATGTDPAFSFTPDDNGTYVVSLTITDEGNTFTDSDTFTIENVAPTASLSGGAVSVPGMPVSFTLGATDPSPVDAAAGFTFELDWNNDGTVDETLSNVPSGTVVTHTFTTTGSATVSMTATDKDGGESAAVTQTVEVKTVALIDDPLSPGDQVLAIGGTEGSDRINLIPGGAGRIRAMVNGQSQGAFAGAERIAVFGLAGDDNIHLAGSIRLPAWLDGGDGNDRLKSAKGNDVLLGGAGDDHLDGSQGADVIIAGAAPTGCWAVPGTTS